MCGGENRHIGTSILRLWQKLSSVTWWEPGLIVRERYWVLFKVLITNNKKITSKFHKPLDDVHWHGDTL